MLTAFCSQNKLKHSILKSCSLTNGHSKSELRYAPLRVGSISFNVTSRYWCNPLRIRSLNPKILLVVISRPWCDARFPNFKVNRFPNFRVNLFSYWNALWISFVKIPKIRPYRYCVPLRGWCITIKTMIGFIRKNAWKRRHTLRYF